jgi:hypothetical protein
LGEPLDRPTFAGGVASLKQNDNFQAFVHDPFLQFHKFFLQTQQLAEVRCAKVVVVARLFCQSIDQSGDPIVAKVEFKLLVEIINDLGLDPRPFRGDTF